MEQLTSRLSRIYKSLCWDSHFSHWPISAYIQVLHLFYEGGGREEDEIHTSQAVLIGPSPNGNAYGGID